MMKVRECFRAIGRGFGVGFGFLRHDEETFVPSKRDKRKSPKENKILNHDFALHKSLSTSLVNQSSISFLIIIVFIVQPH